MSPVLVIGGGTMATGIAARLVSAGVETVVRVRRAETIPAVRAEVLSRLARLAAYHLVPEPSDVPLTVRTDDATGPFGVVIESVAEDIYTKRAVLVQAETLLADDGILATNTSSLPLSELASGLNDAGRFAGWHWFNPAELVPLVEVVGGPRTAPDTLRRLAELSVAIGKEPITVRRDVPGFVANRLQYALLREAYALVEDGVCTVADVDRAVIGGLGARWAAIGPFAAMDAAGLDVHEAAAAQLFPRLSNEAEVPMLLRSLRDRGAAGVKSGEGLCGKYPPDEARRLAAHRDDVLALLSRPVR